MLHVDNRKFYMKPIFPHLTALQKLGLLMVIGLLVLVTLGGTVRVTDSGLSCPDWPLCNGKLIAGGDYHVWLEWTHRLVAMVMGFIILTFAIVVFRHYRKYPWVFFPTVLGIILLGLQVILGGLTVTESLNAVVVSAHLATAMIIVALLVLAVLATFNSSPENQKIAEFPCLNVRRKWLTRVSMLCSICLFGLLVMGAYVSATNAGFFCNEDWPRCNGLWLSGEESSIINMVHRYMAVFVGLLLLGMWALSFSERKTLANVFRLSSLILVLFGTQVILGVLIMWTGLMDWSRVMHLVVGTLTWVVMVTTLIKLIQQTVQLSFFLEQHLISEKNSGQYFPKEM